MDNLTREAEHLHNSTKLYCGTVSTPQSNKLCSMTRKLYDDFRSPINPRELERQATQIKEYLYHGMKGGEMQTTHCSELKAGYEKLRINLRKFE